MSAVPPGGEPVPQPGKTELTVTQPFAPRFDLPADYGRHVPEVGRQREVLADLVRHTPWPALSWAQLSWPQLVEALLRLGRTDIPLARLAEGHIDALRIVDQAGSAAQPGALYGVWASRSQQTGVRARRLGDDQLLLEGTLRFASGAGLLDRALVPVWPDPQTHLLVDLDVAGLPVDSSVWCTGAMAASRTFSVEVAGLVVDRSCVVGAENFYLGRSAFFPGGVGVAACWVGGAARVVDLLHGRHPAPSPAQQLRLGRIRADLAVGAAAVRSTAALLAERLTSTAETDWHLLATEARAVAADAVRRIVAETRLVTGPAGMAMDDGLSHAVNDLELYALQQSSDGDAALLGDPERRA